MNISDFYIARKEFILFITDADFDEKRVMTYILTHRLVIITSVQ